jgi:23S rRNA pseudouridine2605 synthase/16S rRNA pseudouridine516 synthase
VLGHHEAEAAVRAGRVTIDGRAVRQPLAVVKPGEIVRLDGVALKERPVTRVLAFHKPKDTVTSKAGGRGETTVFQKLFEVLPEELRGYEWHAIGRLDKDTTGLLLFTNDERVVTHVASPQSGLAKVYQAKVSGRLAPERLAPLTRGLDLDGEKLRPARFRVLDEATVELTLTEGKFHQVKRMLGAVGYPVLDLTRVAVGHVRLDVPEGRFRELRQEEILALQR